MSSESSKATTCPEEPPALSRRPLTLRSRHREVSFHNLRWQLPLHDLELLEEQGDLLPSAQLPPSVQHLLNDLLLQENDQGASSCQYPASSSSPKLTGLRGSEQSDIRQVTQVTNKSDRPESEQLN